MKGQVLDFSVQTSSGVITGSNGSRYKFCGSEWMEDTPPFRGMSVDFEVQGTNAVAVYRALTGTVTGTTPGSKNKITAGVLAIILGGFGVHKFYLGYIGPGLINLLVNTIGIFVTIFMLCIPNLALYIIAAVEGILYLTKSDEEFEQTYVVGKRPWF